MTQAKSSISSSRHVLNDLLKLPDNVSIVCDDGKVRANMEILSVRSDFFGRGFNNPAFMESQNKSIRMEGCSKAAMEAVKTYLYKGEMDFEKLEISTLLHVMNVSREILIEEELFNCIEAYIKSAVSLKCTMRTVSPCCFELLERFRLDNLWDVLLKAFNFILAILTRRILVPAKTDKLTIKVTKKVFLKDLKSLPLNIVKKISLYGFGAVLHMHFMQLQKLSTKGRFDMFLEWYEANEEICTEEDKKEVLQSFNFDHFTGEELVNVVGRSGLLPREEVDRMVVERFRKCGEGNNQ